MKGNVFEPRGFYYRLDTIESIVKLVTSKCKWTNTVIFYNESAINIIMDDTVMDRPQDTACYTFKLSDEFEEWANLFGKQLDQRSFVEFLKKRPDGEVVDVDNILANIQNLKVATEIIGDYQFDDNNNYSVFFKTTDGESSVKLPKSILFNQVILNGSDKVFAIEVELELIKPREEREKPRFSLNCPKYDQLKKEAAEYEVDRLKESLPDYLILAGTPK